MKKHYRNLLLYSSFVLPSSNLPSTSVQEAAPPSQTRDCSQPFDPAKLVGKPTSDFDNHCIQLEQFWSATPGANEAFYVYQYASGAEQILFLVHSPRTPDDRPAGQDRIVHFVNAGTPARPRERVGYLSELFCWESGKPLFQQKNSIVAAGLARIDQEGVVTPLKIWLLDRANKKLLPGKLEVVACSRKQFHQYYEKSLSPAAKAEINKRLEERGPASAWADPEPLK